MNEILICLNRI